jgi:hypothetical protein
MSSPTRRTVLEGVALVVSAAVFPKSIEARVIAGVSHLCPGCGADLDVGDVHSATCKVASVAVPRDDEIKPDAIKIEGRTYAQEPSGCGARGYDLKSRPPSRGEPGCEARGYDTKSRPRVREEPGCGSRGYDTKSKPPECRSRG